MDPFRPLAPMFPPPMPDMELTPTLPQPAEPAQVNVTADTDISTLPPSQLYELNQHLFEESVPQRELVGDVAPMSVLREEYEKGSAVFLAQIDWLSENGYLHVRRTRGDGDCFYRSVAFAFLERILQAPDKDYASVIAKSKLEATRSLLEQANFQSLVYEEFYDCFVDLIIRTAGSTKEGQQLTEETLSETFRDPMNSNSVVMYLRLLTSAQIRTDPDTYEPFLIHPELNVPIEAKQFCESFVEALGKEADDVQITALARALGIDINIAYLDGRGSGSTVEFVQYRNAPDQENEPLNLLYRPGHYDILVKDKSK